MPVHSCSVEGRPGYKAGDSGKCYVYDPSDEASRKEAKRKAYVQWYAMTEGKMDSEDDLRELAELLSDDEIQTNSVLDTLKGFWGAFREKCNDINSRIWKYVWDNGGYDAARNGQYLAAMQLGRLPLHHNYINEYFEEHGLELVKTLSKTDIAEFKALMIKTADSQLGRDDFLKLVNQSWGISKDRARLIYDNELHEAYINGQERYVQHEIVPYLNDKQILVKRWIHSGSHRPRPYHIVLNGEVAEEGRSFSNGVSQPGGPHCGCKLSYEVKDVSYRKEIGKQRTERRTTSREASIAYIQDRKKGRDLSMPW